MTDTPYVLTPFTIICDSREQAPFSFQGFTADARQGKKPLIVATEVAGLKTGDYSLKGYEDRIAIERKSLEDAYQTFCHGRERFERELARLQVMERALVIIEASWPTILYHPPPHTQFSPKSMYRSVLAWQERFPNVHWWACETRRFAERTTLRRLERFWLDEQERVKQQHKEAG